MNGWLRRCALMLVAGLVAGCLETKDEYTLNPNGSGKVAHEAVLQPMLSLNGNEQETDLPAQLREAVADELSKAQGVDTWTDISFGRKDDGRIWFKGTAYFADLTRLSFHNGGTKIEMLEPNLDRTNGRFVLELKDKAAATAKPVKAPQPALTEAQITERVGTEKAKYQQMRPMLTAMFANLKLEAVYHLPGPVTAVSNFQRTDNGGYRVKLEGARMLAALDQFLADDAWWHNLVATGQNFRDGKPPTDEAFNEKLFGAKGPVRVEVAGTTQPLFDYAKEAAAARAAYPALVKKLGLETVAAAPATGGPLKALRVAGIQWIRFANQKQGLRPFGQEQGYRLALVGEFGGAVRDVTGGALEKATADDGTSLVPEQEWHRQLHSSQLSQDHTAVMFEVTLNAPPAGAKGLSELAGYLECVPQGEAKPVDLGFATFQAGAKGTQFGALIQTRGASKWREGSEQIEVQLKLPKHAIQSLTFYDAQGAKLTAEAAGTSWSDRVTTFTYSMKGQFPDSGKIVADVFEGSQPYRAPFVLRNVSILGEPEK